jgi:hypothetical protein
LRLAGAGLLAATGAIHLDLYLTGYRSIPTIGWLFLLQVIAAFGLAAAVLATGSRPSTPTRSSPPRRHRGGAAGAHPQPHLLERLPGGHCLSCLDRLKVRIIEATLEIRRSEGPGRAERRAVGPEQFARDAREPYEPAGDSLRGTGACPRKPT